MDLRLMLAIVPQAVRGVALMFCYVPANMIALGSLPQDTMKNGAGLYNLMRDLGGAIGLASIGTSLTPGFIFTGTG
jgi:MFS transporter, DHA2 family, multidrug resistance protein